MNRKFYLSIIIVFTLLLAMLSACSMETPSSIELEYTQTQFVKKTDVVETPTETPEPTVPAPVSTIVLDDKTLKGLSITFYHPFVEEQTKVDQLVRDFNLSNVWGLHVSPKAVGGYQALAEGLLTEEEEIVFVLGMSSDLLAAQPDVQWLELNTFAMDPKWGIADFFDNDFVFSEISPVIDEPTPLLTVPIAYNAGILFYNQTWAEELGFYEVPKNTTDLQQQARAALEANTNDNDYYNNGTGGLWLSQSPLSALSWYASFGGGFENEIEGRFSPDQEPMLDSFTFLKTAYESDLSWIGVDSSPYRYFSERMAILTEGTLDDLVSQSAYQEASALNDSWTSLAYLDEEGRNRLVLEPISFAIRKSDYEKELGAWLFGRWLLNDSQQARLAEIHGYWPSTGDPETIASAYAYEHETWTTPLRNNPIITLVPQDPSWEQTRLVFQDAYQRVYNLAPEYFPSILEVFDQTMRINEEQRP